MAISVLQTRSVKWHLLSFKYIFWMCLFLCDLSWKNAWSYMLLWCFLHFKARPLCVKAHLTVFTDWQFSSLHFFRWGSIGKKKQKNICFQLPLYSAAAETPLWTGSVDTWHTGVNAYICSEFIKQIATNQSQSLLWSSWAHVLSQKSRIYMYFLQWCSLI